MTKKPSPLAILFPVHRPDPEGPMTAEDAEQLQRVQLEAIQRCWRSDGVKALVQMLEMETAMKQGNACLPGATAHDAGQAFALQQLVNKIQKAKWAKKKEAED